MNPISNSTADEARMPAADAYRRQSRRRLAVLCVAFLVTVLSTLTDIAWGPSFVAPQDLITTIVDPGAAPTQLAVIVWDLRLPIAIMAVLVGAMLGAAGAEMQTILSNPLADPFTLGISSAASFGAALAIVAQINLVPIAGPFLVTANAFFLALATSFVLYAFTRMRGVTAETMILVGIALMFTFNALLGLMQYAATEIQLAQIVFWMMGSLARATWTKIYVCAAMLAVALPFFISRSWSLTALRMGDDRAMSLGINVRRLRIETLIVISLLSATAVSFVGTVAFVGLIGPHIARMIVGEDQRYFLPLAAVAGALIMSLTSIVSKALVVGVVLPIGMITSLIGIPFFVSLILSARKRNWR